MKKLLFTLTICILSFVSFGQGPVFQPNYLPNFQQFGSATTMTRINGVVYPAYGLVNAEWPDTATTNLTTYKNIPGLEIRVGNKKFLRNTTATAWIEIGSGSGGGGSGITMLGTGSCLTRINDSTYNVDTACVATKLYVKHYADSIKGTIPVHTFPYSVVAPGNAVQLENDTTASPANYFYGRNSAGRRGWYPQSSIVGVNLYNSDGTLTGNRTIAGGGNSFSISNTSTINTASTGSTIIRGQSVPFFYSLFETNPSYANIESARSTADLSKLSVEPDGITFYPDEGNLKIDSLNYTLSTTGKKIMLRDTVTGLVENIDPALLGSSNTFTNGLTESGGTVKLGGTLSEETTIDTDGNDLLINGTGNIEIGVINGGYLEFSRIGLADIGVTGMSRIYIADTLKINPFRSSLKIDSLNYTLSTTGKKVMVRDTATGLVQNIDPALIGSGGSPALSSITAATGMNIINNEDYEQVWEWNSLTGNGLYLNSNSTTAESNQQTLFSAYMSGANANSTQTTYAASFANEHTGTASTNIAAVFNATNGTTNYAAQFRRGKTSFGTVGTESGILEINGSTSGTVTIQPAAVAGTPTLTLPTTTSTLVGDVVPQTLTNKRWVPRIGSTTSSATPTINTDNVDIYKLTAQAVDITDASTNLSGNPNDGDVFEVQITGTATRNINWGASFVSSTISLPTATNGTNTLTVIFQYYATSSYGNNKWVVANYY